MTLICIPNAKLIKRRPVRTSFPYNMSFKGDGVISGVVREKGIPRAGIILTLVSPDKQRFINATVSDVDGSYSFSNLDRTQTYDVIAFDVEGVWEKKISSDRRPVLADTTFAFSGLSGESSRLRLEHRGAPSMWRLFIINPGSHGAVAEIEMASEAGGPNLCVSGTSFSSGDFAGAEHSHPNAFDGVYDGTNCWASDGKMPMFIGYQFPEVTPINEIRVFPRQQYAYQTPQSFIVQSSADGIDWYDEWTVTDQIAWTASPRYFTRGSGETIVPVSYSQSVIWDAQTTANFERLNSESLAEGVGNNAMAQNYIRADLGESKYVNAVTVAGGTLPGWSGVSQYLNGASIQYSDDDANWTTIATVSDLENWTPLSVRKYYTRGITARYWRIYKEAHSYLATTRFRLEA